MGVVDWRQLGVLSTTSILTAAGCYPDAQLRSQSSGGAVKSDKKSIGFELQPPGGCHHHHGCARRAAAAGGD